MARRKKLLVVLLGDGPLAGGQPVEQERITEDGLKRITEDGQIRTTETNNP